MRIALLFGLIVLNGLLAMAEIALVTARKSRLRRMAEDGDRAAAAALRLAEDPTRFLSTIQIGITAIGLLNGIMGEAALAGRLGLLLSSAGLSPRTAGVLSTALVVAGVTYVSIVVGELVPKRLAQNNAEALARIAARPVAWLSMLSRPFVFLLSVSTDALLALTGKRDGGANLTEEDIEAVLADGSRSGVIEKEEHNLVRNVFRLDSRLVASLMTPRSEFVFFDTEQPFDETVRRLVDSNHSRFPVCHGDVNRILGIISAKRILRKIISGTTEPIDNHLQPAVFVPETLNAMKLLEQLRETGAKMVFVADEYGEVLGLITLQNILEALAGEFRPRDPEDLWAVRREDGSWLLDGLIPVPELKDRLGLRSVPDEDKGRYNTLAGLILHLHGSIPKIGDAVVWENWRLEVVDLDGIRIDKVMASRIVDNA